MKETDASQKRMTRAPSAADIPNDGLSLVPLGCLAPIVYLLLLLLDFFASLPSIGPTSDLVARCMNCLSGILLFPFSIIFASTDIPILYHLLSCAFWTSMFVLSYFLLKRNRCRKTTTRKIH